MDNRPIGMFDSGVGGLTVLKEIKNKCPNEDIVYLGDTKSFPYGSKSKENIINLTKKGIEFLISKNVKAVIIACGTATSQALEEVQNCYNIPIIGIIDETVKYIKEKEYKKIGVIATTGTIRSKGWQNKLSNYIPDAVISSKDCPLLAPMAEEGWTDNDVAKFTIKEYLKELKNNECLILGCTHYPLFSHFIREEMGDECEIINTGKILSERINEMLINQNIENNNMQKGQYNIFLTDMEENFVKVANQLLQGEEIDKKIQIVKSKE